MMIDHGVRFGSQRTLRTNFLAKARLAVSPGKGSGFEEKEARGVCGAERANWRSFYALRF